MDASHLVDAATTSFIASVGIWAAVVRRHWFLRFAVVGGVLAMGLLVPAYEIVMEFAIQVAVISAGVALWRGARIRRPRMSLETALLAMVVAAVMAAVVGAAPTFGWDTWVRIVFLGVTLGTISLLSLWIACGRASLPTRLIGGALGTVVFIAIFHFGIALRDAYYASQRGNGWWSYFVTCYRPDFLVGWLIQVAPGIILGVITFTSLLMLARGSGWFAERDATNDLAPSSRAIKTVSRLCLCAAFSVIAAANAFLLNKLCTRPVLPTVTLPAPNGYDDFLAAGRHPGADFSQVYQQTWRSWSDQDLARAITGAQPAYDLIEAGLRKESWATSGAASDAIASADQGALINVGRAIGVRLEDCRRRDQWAAFTDYCCQVLETGHKSSRGMRSDYSVDLHFEQAAADHVRMALGALSSTECKELALRLLALDKLREPMSVKVERTYQFEFGSSWQDYMRYLVYQWNGQTSALDMRRDTCLINANLDEAGMKLAIVELALQAYWLDHQALPDSLAELVPGYLPSVPLDPMDHRPLRYKRDQGVYRVYSVERNRLDDGGVSYLNGQIADDVHFGPHLPPVPDRWKRAAAEYAARARANLKAISDAAAALQERRIRAGE